MLPPNNTLNIEQSTHAGMVRPGSYTESAPQDIVNFNQWMMKYAEYFAPFIQAALMKQPRHWYNAIARGVKENFSGLTNETRIFRGGLGHYSGLSMFSPIDVTPDEANTGVCGGGSWTTGEISWDRLQWSGYTAYWGSDPICVDQWQYTPEAQTQLAWILQYGASRGIDIQEVWNRDWLIRTATVDADGGAGRGYLMSKTYVGNETPEKFYYDPLVDPTACTAGGLTKPFIVFKAGVEIETLNFGMLDALHDELDIACPDGAMGSMDGQPLYGLPIAPRDFEKWVLGSGHQVDNFRWASARVESLITGIKNVSTHRGWALPGDGNQIRFKIRRVVTGFDSDQYGGVGADLDGETVVVAEAVDPQIPGRVGENGSRIPKVNPDYINAELAVAPVQLNKVFTNLMGSQLTTLGSGTVFGPHPGLNGVWRWLNIIDRATNPHGKKGNFEGEFKIFPKPEPRVVYSTAVLYRRCTETIRARCPVDNAEVNPDTATGTSAEAASYSCSDGDVANNALTLACALTKTLKDLPPAGTVTLTFTGQDLTLTAIATKVASAPSYVFRTLAADAGEFDLVALADAAATKFHIGADGYLYYTPAEGPAVQLILDSVSIG